MMLLESVSSARTKLLWSIVGVVGTIIVNVIRVALIVVAIYLYGIEIGGLVHSVIGYILFFAWLGLFFYLFSKREAIATRLHLRVNATTR